MGNAGSRLNRRQQQIGESQPREHRLGRLRDIVHQIRDAVDGHALMGGQQDPE